MSKKKFAAWTYNIDHVIFMVYIVSFANLDLIYYFHKTWIVFLKVDNYLLMILTKYTNFINILNSVQVAKLWKYIGIQDYIIVLLDRKQVLCLPIYSQKSVKLKILNTYIKINIAINFKWHFKLFVENLIIFIWELDGHIYRCVNY